MTLALLLTVAASFAVAGVIGRWLAAQARTLLLGPPVLVTPRCASCGSQLRAAGRSLPATCQECGRSTLEAGAVIRTRPARERPSHAALSRCLALVATAVIAVVALSAATVGARMVARHVPVLLAEAAAQRQDPGSRETRLRWARGEIDALGLSDQALVLRPDRMDLDELRAFVDALLAANTMSERRPNLATAAVELARRDPAARDSLREAISSRIPAPRCLATSRVVPNGTVVLMLLQPLMGPEAWMAIEAVRIDGAPVEVTSPLGAIRPGLLEHGVSGTPTLLATMTAPATPGTFTLEIDWSADWPVAGRHGEPTIPGLRPVRRTERRTLVVAAGPETVDATAGPEALDIAAFDERPYLALVRPLIDEPGRIGAYLRLPRVPVAMPGTWTIRTPPLACEGASPDPGTATWFPLVSRSANAEMLAVTAYGLVPDPRALGQDEIRVRFEPATGPYTLPPESPRDIQRYGGTATRAIDSVWREPIELVLRRNTTSGFAWWFRLERIERLDPKP